MELDISGEVLSAKVEAAEQYSELFHNDAEQHKLFPTQVKMIMNFTSFGGVYQQHCSWCKWGGRNPNAILIKVIVKPKYGSSNKKTACKNSDQYGYYSTTSNVS